MRLPQANFGRGTRPTYSQNGGEKIGNKKGERQNGGKRGRMFTLQSVGILLLFFLAGFVIVMMVFSSTARTKPGWKAPHSVEVAHSGPQTSANGVPACQADALGLTWMLGGPNDPDEVYASVREKGPCGSRDQAMYQRRTDYHWLGIGIQKGGTTTLFGRLFGHPASFMGEKEMGFFLRGELDMMDPASARKFYAEEHWWYTEQVDVGKRRGEITPNYQTQPIVAHRIKHILGQPQRFIMLLRDPVERAYSFYQMRKRLGVEEQIRETFELSIQREYDTIARCRNLFDDDPSWYNECYIPIFPHVGCLGHGMYYLHLLGWYQYYPPCSVMVIDQSDLNLPGTDQCIYAFLDMYPYDFQLNEGRNATGWEARDQYNSQDPMLPSTRQRLQRLFKPFNRDLENLVGRTFSWGY